LKNEKDQNGEMKMIVTGGSSGIGRSVVTRARAEGWDVLAPPRTELELRDGDSIRDFTAYAIEWCGGRLDALINNAATALAGAVEELRIEDVREQFEVNVFGHLQITQQLLSSVREARGHVIFVSSDRAARPVPFYGAYAASKRAITGFAGALALEVESCGVAVSVVELGAYESNIRTAIRSEFDDIERRGTRYPELLREMKSRLGQPPLGDPADAAAMILDLLNKSPAVPPDREG
jgi:NAD(P)-dependent dehydrogenase (short-subunit alcohol dehydrogenase family)